MRNKRYTRTMFWGFIGVMTIWILISWIYLPETYGGEDEAYWEEMRAMDRVELAYQFAEQNGNDLLKSYIDICMEKHTMLEITTYTEVEKCVDDLFEGKGKRQSARLPRI